jgi:homoserine kinase type II
MAVFTPVDDTQLAAWLDAYSLGQAVTLDGIPSGIENSNFFLTTTQGHYVLTLFENLTARALPFYLNLMRHLAGCQIPVPDPVMRNDGALFGLLCGKPAVLATWLDGTVQDAPTVVHCTQLGQMLARLHLAGSTFGTSQPLQPNLYGLPWQHQTASQIQSFLSPQQQSLLRTELSFQQNFSTLPAYAALPAGPCHCDLFRNNVLFITEDAAVQNVRLGGLLDFYFAGDDKWLFDIAVCVNDWCITSDGQLDPVRVLAFLHAYQIVRPLTHAEADCWSVLLRAGALRFWLSRLYDYHLPRQAEMLKPHDPGHFERILRLRIETTSPIWLPQEK